MKAAVLRGDEGIRIEELEQPRPGRGELVVRVKACGLCGSDLHKLRKRPLNLAAVLGHEISGEVVEVGEGVDNFQAGERVVVAHHVPCYVCHYCRHGNHSMCRSFKASNVVPGGFAQFIRVPEANVRLGTLRLSPTLSFEQASFTEPLACCLRSLKRCPIQPGDVGLVVGLGPMGLLMAQLLRRDGAVVVGVDLLPERLKLGSLLGVEHVSGAGLTGEELKGMVRELTAGRGADVAVVTVADGRLLPGVMELVRDGGIINLFASSPFPSPIPLDPSQLYYRELTIYGSYSSSPLELVHALHMLESGAVSVQALISHRLPLEGLSQAVELAERHEAMKVIIIPN